MLKLFLKNDTHYNQLNDIQSDVENQIENSEDSQQTDELSICRICLDTNDQHDMICPCICDGTMKFVHRTCLQKWRTIDIQSPNFNRCNLCLSEYIIDDTTSCWEKCWIYICTFIVSNLLLLFIIIQIILWGLQVMFEHIDHKGNFFQNHFNIKLSSPLVEWYILSGFTLVISFICIIIIHDLFIYIKFKPDNYFTNYADLGIIRLICFIFMDLMLFCQYVFMYIDSIVLVIILHKIFKHMLERFYSIDIGRTSYVYDLRDVHIQELEEQEEQEELEIQEEQEEKNDELLSISQ